MTRVDAVIVSYNSGDDLRRCVESLLGIEGVTVIVVDNASTTPSLSVLEGLEVTAVALEHNNGFGYGCNVGWRLGSSPLVLFLNPDAAIDADALRTLVEKLESSERSGCIAPRITHPDGSLHWSLRRFPTVARTWSQALFLHRLFPTARWADELVRSSQDYERAGSPDWVSGACMLTRRSLLQSIGGFDETFFMYCEDTDLCRRIRLAGHEVSYEPAATITHVGGASAPRPALLPVLASSKVRYARKHSTAIAAGLIRVGLTAGALTHLLLGRGGEATRSGHARSLRLLLSRRAGKPSRPARSSTDVVASILSEGLSREDKIRE